MDAFTINKKVYRCPIELTLQTIMGKWKAVLLWDLRQEVKRYGELKKSHPNITHKMLTQQLRELEEDGIVQRKVYAVVPPKVEYSLTDQGREIIPILEMMGRWGSRFRITGNNLQRSSAQPMSDLMQGNDQNQNCAPQGDGEMGAESEQIQSAGNDL